MNPSVDQLPGRLDLKLVSGDDFLIALTFNRPDGTPVNLTGYVITARVKDVQFTSTITSATSGQLNLTLSAAQTSTLKKGQQLGWSLKWVDSESNTLTVLNGELSVFNPGEVF